MTRKHTIPTAIKSTAAAKRKAVLAAPVVKIERKKPRLSPGVKSSREVVKSQKSTYHCLTRSRLHRVLRKSISEDVKFSKGALEAFQLVIESDAIEVLRQAHMICTHRGGKRLEGADVILALKLRGEDEDMLDEMIKDRYVEQPVLLGFQERGWRRKVMDHKEKTEKKSVDVQQP